MLAYPGTEATNSRSLGAPERYRSAAATIFGKISKSPELQSV